jgi:osmotically-inducible protein OsmY
MNFNLRGAKTLALTFAFGLGSLLAFQDAPAPDNTKVNKQDRNASQPTADQAKNKKSDVKIMSEIRRSVVKDKTLSVYAHNVKIISKGGMVTLKGPVHSDDEKKNIEAKAVAVAGDGNVTDQITVKGDSK